MNYSALPYLSRRRDGRVFLMVISLIVVASLGGLGAWYLKTHQKEEVVVEVKAEEKVVVVDDAPVGDIFEGRRNAHGIFFVPIDEVLAKNAEKAAAEGTAVEK